MTEGSDYPWDFYWYRFAGNEPANPADREGHDATRRHLQNLLNRDLSKILRNYDRSRFVDAFQGITGSKLYDVVGSDVQLRQNLSLTEMSVIFELLAQGSKYGRDYIPYINPRLKRYRAPYFFPDGSKRLHPYSNREESEIYSSSYQNIRAKVPAAADELDHAGQCHNDGRYGDVISATHRAIEKTTSHLTGKKPHDIKGALTSLSSEGFLPRAVCTGLISLANWGSDSKELGDARHGGDGKSTRAHSLLGLSLAASICSYLITVEELGSSIGEDE